MKRVILASTLALFTLATSRAEAQQGGSAQVQSEAGESTIIITTLPDQPPATQGHSISTRGYVHPDLEEANRGIRNTRNALIATSAVAAVGMIVGSTAASQCDFIYRFNQRDELICTDRGDALLAAGGTIFGLAAVGMITSGIMLGVRKGKRRRLRRELQNQTYGTRLQWNSESGRLEF
jgi:hypothetical protein